MLTAKNTPNQTMGEETQIHKRELEADPRIEIKTNAPTKRQTTSANRVIECSSSEASMHCFQVKMLLFRMARKGKRSQNQGQNMTTKSRGGENYPVSGLRHPTPAQRAAHGTTQQTTAQEHLPCTCHVPCQRSRQKRGQPP